MPGILPVRVQPKGQQPPQFVVAVVPCGQHGFNGGCVGYNASCLEQQFQNIRPVGPHRNDQGKFAAGIAIFLIQITAGLDQGLDGIGTGPGDRLTPEITVLGAACMSSCSGGRR